MILGMGKDAIENLTKTLNKVRRASADMWLYSLIHTHHTLHSLSKN